MEQGLQITAVLREVGNKDLLGLLEHYFQLSLRTEKLCGSFQKYVKKARDGQIIIDRALAVQESGRIPLSEEECKEIMDELRMFRAAAGGDLISCVGEEFRTLYDTHVEMQSKLGVLKTKMDKKLKYLKGLMKGCSIAAGLVNRLTSLLYSQPRLRDLCEGDWWVKSLGMFTSQQVLVEQLNLGTFFICKDMESMKVLVDRLEGELARVSTSIEFGERHGNCCALLLAMGQIRSKRCGFLKQLADFERQIDICNKTICKTRTAVLQKLSARRNLLMELKYYAL